MADAGLVQLELMTAMDEAVCDLAEHTLAPGLGMEAQEEQLPDRVLQLFSD